MWYSKGPMRALFFLGAAMILIGLGLMMMRNTIPGAILMSIGVAAAVIGFMGLRLNLLVDMRVQKKKRREESRREE